MKIIEVKHLDNYIQSLRRNQNGMSESVNSLRIQNQCGLEKLAGQEKPSQKRKILEGSEAEIQVYVDFGRFYHCLPCPLQRGLCLNIHLRALAEL